MMQVSEAEIDAAIGTGKYGDEYEHSTLLYQLMLPFMWVLARWAQLKRFIFHAFQKDATEIVYKNGKEEVRVRPKKDPKTNSFWVDGLSAKCRAIKEGAASWRALEIIYNHQNRWITPINLLDNFWLNIRNAQAVRNRFRIIEHELARAIIDVGARKTDGSPVRIVSLAAGSAEPVIRAAGKAKKFGYNVRVHLVDFDQDNPEQLPQKYIERYAKLYGVSEEVTFEATNIYKIINRDELGNYQPDIVEMLGFLDYLKDNTAMHVIRKIYRALPVGGYFFTCHIHDNPEKDFLFNVVDWGRIAPFIMLYRTVEQLRGLIENAFDFQKVVRNPEDIGAKFESVRLVTEPHRIHSVAIAIK